MTLPVPPDRARGAHDIAALLEPGRRVALTTHVNADGDGVGSEVALWHLLTARRVQAAIANPTPIPSRFDFLVPSGADRSDRAAQEIAAADVIVVLDISDLSRLGDLATGVMKARGPTACIDHHVSQGSLPGGPRLVAPDAAATAELVFDLATALGWDLTPEAARALYVGILTDTGAFRFANTTPRVLQVASALLGRGVVPVARKRGCRGAGARVRRRGPPQGCGGVCGGLARRGAAAGAGRGAAAAAETMSEAS